jgi:DNA-binding MurR/RpiR family transcriptional regulator
MAERGVQRRQASIVLAKLAQVRRDVGPARQRVIDYLLEHPARAVHQSIAELADAAGSSEATVIRLIQALGYKGYHDFKIRLSQSLEPTSEEVEALSRDLSPDDPIEAVVQSIFGLSVETLQSTRQLADPAALDQAIALLARANRIEFYGAGGSGVVAQDGYHKFIRLGIPVNAVSDSHNAAQICAVMRPGDVLVVISHSGRTRDALDAASLAREAGAGVIAISRYGRSPLQRLANVTLHTLSPETSYRSEAIASRIAQLALIDTLLVGVYLRRVPESSERLVKARKALVDKRVP